MDSLCGICGYLALLSHEDIITTAALKMLHSFVVKFGFCGGKYHGDIAFWSHQETRNLQQCKIIETVAPRKAINAKIRLCKMCSTNCKMNRGNQLTITYLDVKIGITELIDKPYYYWNLFDALVASVFLSKIPFFGD